jgi:hypothetical protein
MKYSFRDKCLLDGVKLTAAQFELNPIPSRESPWSGGMRRNIVTVSNLSISSIHLCTTIVPRHTHYLEKSSYHLKHLCTFDG